MVDLLLLSYSRLFCEMNSCKTPSKLWQIMLSYQSKVGWLVTFSASKCMISNSVFFPWKSFYVKFSSQPKLFLQSRSKFQTSLRHYISPLLLRDSILQGCEKGNFANFAQKICRQSPKMPSVFILEGRQPPWPSWQGALSEWDPRTAWKCSWWKPSPCTADQCHYLMERLKVGKWNLNESKKETWMKLKVCVKMIHSQEP